jgi:hypothetical protein
VRLLKCNQSAGGTDNLERNRKQIAHMAKGRPPTPFFLPDLTRPFHTHCQVGKQVVGALFIVGWNIVVTSIIMNVIRLVIPLRMSDEHLEIGDEAAHGEDAYALWGEGQTYDESVHDESVMHGLYGYEMSAHKEKKVGETRPEASPADGPVAEVARTVV